MDIKSHRSKEIENIISNKERYIGEWPLEIGGEVKRHDFFKLPIEFLRFNTNNGRLTMEIREWERTHQKHLDADDSEDAKIIRDLLLSQDKTASELLIIDLEAKGQIEPGVITHDGYVINGNRRMAALQILHEKHPSGKFENLEAIVLQKDISNKDLWRIEAGLQLSKDKISEYHPVNELLKIKEGKDAGFNSSEIAAAMYGRTEDEVSLALERLDLIDGFLEYCGQKENYGLIKTFGLHEHFIDIQNTILAPARKEGQPNRIIQKRLNETFAFIKAGTLDTSKRKEGKKKNVTHYNVRELGKIYADNDAKYEFSKTFDEKLKNKKTFTPIEPEQILEAFQTAKEVLANKADRGKPIILIERATKALSSIDISSKHLKDESVKDAFLRLNNIMDKISKVIQK